MRKIIVLSVNENPIYQFTLPLVVWSWVRIGWPPFIFINAPDSKTLDLVKVTMSNQYLYFLEKSVDNIEGYRSDTIAQVSRLYASLFLIGDNYFLTCDSDMMALSDYWKPDPKKITVYGHDLTNFQQMPMCFIGMKAEKWRDVMNLTEELSFQQLIKRDLYSMPDSGENGNQINRWCTDQRLITQRINETQFEKEFVHRGTLANGYPVGRIDRSAWATYHPNPIDAHLPHDIYSNDETFMKVMRMLHSVFPEDDFKWFVDYTAQFKKTLQ